MGTLQYCFSGMLPHFFRKVSIPAEPDCILNGRLSVSLRIRHGILIYSDEKKDE
jgi:hypothetical protein